MAMANEHDEISSDDGRSQDASPADSSAHPKDVDGRKRKKGAASGEHSASRTGSNKEDSAEAQKRKKKAVSCEGCRRRKLKCDRGWPCGACRDRDESHLCTWEGGTRPQGTGRDQDNAPLLLRMERMETLLTQISAKIGALGSAANVGSQDSRTQSKAASSSVVAENRDVNLTRPSSAQPSQLGELSKNAARRALLCTSFKKTTAEHATAELWDIMKILPDTETVRRLCRHYFEEIHFMFYAVEEAHFWMVGLREHEELRMMNNIQQGRVNSESDPKRHLQFLGLLLAMIALTLYFGEVDEFSDVTAHVGQSPAYGVFLDASQRAISASNPFDEPNLLSLRCLILQVWGISSVRGPSVGQAVLAMAIHYVYSLGLDVEPPLSMPLAQRRDRIRLFYSLALLDWFGTGITKRSYLVREEPIKHPYLFGRKSMKEDFHDNSDSILLPDMWVKLEMARINRLASDRTGMTDEDAYASTLHLQEELNELVADLPPEFEAEIDITRESLNHAAFHRLITLSIVANQLINLHKRFYIQGWLNPKYESSRHICFSSARRICLLFRKIFSYNIPIKTLMNTDMSRIHRLMETRQRFSSRMWFFVHSSVGACLLLEHHYALMEVHPKEAGPNAEKVRAEILEDLRITRRVLVALSARSEMAKYAVSVLSKPEMAYSVVKGAHLDPTTPSGNVTCESATEENGEDEEALKRRAELAQDLRSITDVDTFATKRLKMQGDLSHVYYRSRRYPRSTTGSYEMPVSPNTSSSAARSAGGQGEDVRHGSGFLNDQRKESPRVHGRDNGHLAKLGQNPNRQLVANGDGENADSYTATGGTGMDQGASLNYSEMQALLNATLSTDIGTGMPMAPEIAFEREADWIGSSHPFGSGSYFASGGSGGGVMSPFSQAYMTGGWDAFQQQNNASTSEDQLAPPMTQQEQHHQQQGQPPASNMNGMSSVPAHSGPPGPSFASGVASGNSGTPQQMGWY